MSCFTNEIFILKSLIYIMNLRSRVMVRPLQLYGLENNLNAPKWSFRGD